MLMLLGEKIKELRKRDGRKQADLASALGVTEQAVSRWESNKGYPDMEMIPAIANYFHVTIDELFGYDNDRNQKLSDYLKKANAMLGPEAKFTKQSVDKTLSFLRDALAEFPNEWQLQFRLSVALSIKSYFVDKSRKAKEESLREAAELLEQAKNNTDDPHWENKISGRLADLYFKLGDSANVEKIAEGCSPANVCREIILAKTPDVNKAKDFNEQALLSLVHEAVFLAVMKRADDCNRAFEDKLDLYLSFARIIASVLDGRQYGFFHIDMYLLYGRALRLSVEKGMKKEALEYFDKMYEHLLGFKEAWKKKGNDPDTERPKTITDYPGPIMYIDEAQLRNVINRIPEEIAEKIRKSDKYREVLE